jgi:hypothetical protein
MIALADQSPEVNVAAAEYQRLLGYPRDHVIEGRAVELAEQAREWYAEHDFFVDGRQFRPLPDGRGSVSG